MRFNNHKAPNTSDKIIKTDSTDYMGEFWDGNGEQKMYDKDRNISKEGFLKGYQNVKRGSEGG